MPYQVVREPATKVLRCSTPDFLYVWEVWRGPGEWLATFRNEQDAKNYKDVMECLESQRFTTVPDQQINCCKCGKSLQEPEVTEDRDNLCNSCLSDYVSALNKRAALKDELTLAGHFDRPGTPDTVQMSGWTAEEVMRREG